MDDFARRKTGAGGNNVNGLGKSLSDFLSKMERKWLVLGCAGRKRRGRCWGRKGVLTSSPESMGRGKVK